MIDVGVITTDLNLYVNHRMGLLGILKPQNPNKNFLKSKLVNF